MIRFITLLVIVLYVTFANAQFVYNDFDSNQNVEFNGYPWNPTIVANPDPSGINTSPNVARWDRSWEGWPFMYALLDGYIDFSTGNLFQLKIYSPISCQINFQLEDKHNNPTQVELISYILTPNQWELLTFDFTGSSSDTYDMIVIFIDGGNYQNNEFFIDDIEGPEFIDGCHWHPLTLPVTFEDDSVGYNPVDFGGNDTQIIQDPTNTSNKVARTIKTIGSQFWAGTNFAGILGFSEPVPFEPGETFMHLKVWSPSAQIPVRLLMRGANDTIRVETESLTTANNSWETLVFDFSNQVPGTDTINFDYCYYRPSIFFNFGVEGTGEIYYWDDLVFGNLTSLTENYFDEIKLYPNPAKQKLHLSTKGREIITEVCMYSLNSSMVMQARPTNNTMDITTLQPGMYIVEVTVEGRKVRQKLLVQR